MGVGCYADVMGAVIVWVWPVTRSVGGEGAWPDRGRAVPVTQRPSRGVAERAPLRCGGGGRGRRDAVPVPVPVAVAVELRPPRRSGPAPAPPAQVPAPATPPARAPRRRGERGRTGGLRPPSRRAAPQPSRRCRPACGGRAVLVPAEHRGSLVAGPGGSGAAVAALAWLGSIFVRLFKIFILYFAAVVY